MELEAKFKCENIREIIEGALKKGFVLKKKKQQIDTYFIVNQTSEEGTRDYLRLREDIASKSLSLDYHRVLSELETEETEIKVDNKEGIIYMLKKLGYEVQCIVNKKREQYEKGKLIITVDNVEGLGTFVEIEINDDLTDENKNLIYSLAEELGLSKKDRVSMKGYPDLLIEKK